MAKTSKTRLLTISRDTARLLSESTYHELVLALREMVANSHDAQSPTVDIKLDFIEGSQEGGCIVVSDRGDGMDEKQFERVFLQLGSSSRRTEGRPARRNKYGRRVIGQFGIGFIAAVPFANRIIVETATESCRHVHGVEINCSAIMSGSNPEDYAHFDFAGWNRDRTANDPPSFTSIRLQDLTRLAYDSIDAELRGGWYQPRAERRKPIDRERREEFVTNWLSRVLPLGYSLPEKAQREEESTGELREELKQLLPKGYYPLQVHVNGKRIYRPLPEAVFKGNIFELEGESGPWKARGILWSPQEIITPFYLRGIPMRIGDMAIGRPEYFRLNEVGRVYGKLQHIAGEVHLEGFGHLINLDRQSLKGSAQTDEFFGKIQQLVAKFESSLQEKAHVMQRARDLKKRLDANISNTYREPSLASVLTARSEAEKLVTKARELGIQVEETDDDVIEVPKGERSVKIGRRLGEELLTVRVGNSQVRIVVEQGVDSMTDAALAHAVMVGGDSLTITGPHPLLAHDQWAIANARLLAVLRRGHVQGVLDHNQITWIIKELGGLYQ